MDSASNSKNPGKLDTGFTLVELLVVIAIIGILTTILVVVINPVKIIEKSRVTAAFGFAQSVHRQLSINSVVEWDFNNSADTSHVSDESSNNNQGTIAGASFNCTDTPYQYVNQGSGQCSLSLDGSDSVSAPNSPTTNITSNKFTISAWFKPSVDVTSMTATYPILVIKRPWLVGGYAAHFTNTNGRINIQYCKSDGTSCPSLSSQTSFKGGQWYHYAGTFDGTTLSLYVNGKLEAQSSQPGTVGSSATSSLQIGTSFQGLIDDIRIYSGSLVTSQVHKLYAQTSMNHF